MNGNYEDGKFNWKCVENIIMHCIHVYIFNEFNVLQQMDYEGLQPTFTTNEKFNYIYAMMVT